ncbi:MAG: ABC transporter substrate-binding protein [Myxococcales bacterium]
MFRRALPLPVLAFALFGTLACKSNAPEGAAPGGEGKGPIVVGEVGSMTGSEATFGIASDRGIKLAVQEVNAAGGVKARQIEVHALDDQSKPEEAATAVTRLIASDHIVALLGEVASTISLRMAPKAQQAKVPMISPSSTNPKVTQEGDYIFRACFIDTFQGYVMAKFASSDLKVKKVGVLKDVRSDYSVGLAQSFSENLASMGGTVVASESYSKGDVDFKAQLTNLKAAAPQAIFIPGYYTDVGLIARQAREVGLTIPLLGGDGWESDKLYDIGREALDGGYFSTHYASDDPDPVIQGRIKHFGDNFQKAFGVVPDGLSAQAYDAAGLLADAMKRATEITGPAIRDALAATKGYPGVTGDITMDKNRNPVKSAVVVKIGAGGKFQYVTRIAPEGAPAAPSTGATTPADAAKGGTNPGGNTAPLAAPGGTPTKTTAPATGAQSPAQGATSGQPQGAPAGGSHK